MLYFKIVLNYSHSNPPLPLFLLLFCAPTLRLDFILTFVKIDNEARRIRPVMLDRIQQQIGFHSSFEVGSTSNQASRLNSLEEEQQNTLQGISTISNNVSHFHNSCNEHGSLGNYNRSGIGKYNIFI
ncbi:hypothetical protein HHK36_028211 [Tetracentron sinense]|uniref:Uncharacterized protein n=1 Tax=Tetracentron sinense TaxID=13715 RepID=A0A834YEF9_TETSI|nr:hypothetical protein HHK36_028211 [Tetracentron sinense]